MSGSDSGKGLFAVLKARAEANKAGTKPTESLNKVINEATADAKVAQEHKRKSNGALFDELRLSIDPWVNWQVVYFMRGYTCGCCGNTWTQPSAQTPFVKEIHFKDKTAFRYRPVRGLAYQMYKQLPRIILWEPSLTVWSCWQCFDSCDLFLGSAERAQQENAIFEDTNIKEGLSHASNNDPGEALLQFKGSAPSPD